jgi:RNA polymerase-binding transcription factor DksA
MATKKATPKKEAAPAKKAATAKKSPVSAKAAPVKSAPKPATPEKKTAKAAPAATKSAKAATPAKSATKPSAKSAPAKPAVKAQSPKATVKKSPAEVPQKSAKPAAATQKSAKPAAASQKSAKPAAAARTSVPSKDKARTQVKKPPAPSQEVRFAETSKVTASPAEIRKALRAKESKKETKPVAMPKINSKSARKYEPEFTRSLLDTKEEVIETTPTQRYSDMELAEFRELIQNKLSAAKQELAYLNGLITRKDTMSGEDSDSRYMTMEDGSLSMEREQLSQMASRQIDFIEKLEKGLMRIQNKTYGICRVTGKLIDRARLRAVPHATLSMEAKTKMNRPGSNFNQ